MNREDSFRRARRPAWAAPICALALLVAAGCGGSDPAGPGNPGGEAGSELVGAWTVTSFLVSGTDMIPSGMTVVLSFTEGGASPSGSFLRGVQGEFRIEVGNDVAGICDGGSDCETGGTFEVADGQLVFDPGTEDEVRWDYSVAGGALTMSGLVEGILLEVTASRG